MVKQLASFLLGAALTLAATQTARALDNTIYDNLNRSRDALLDQRQHLQEQYDSISRLLDQYQQKLSILDGYMKQNDQALRDIDNALNRAR